MANINVKTLIDFAGTVTPSAPIINQPLTCAIGYNISNVYWDTATGAILVGSINATTIVATMVVSKCDGSFTILQADKKSVDTLINNPCCITYINFAMFVNLVGDTSFPATAGGNVNFPKVYAIDLSNYGGNAFAVVSSNSDIINAFANLPNPIAIQINNGMVYFPSTYVGSITDIEVHKSLLSATLTISGDADNTTISTSSNISNGNSPSSLDKLRILATMNGINLNTGLISIGDTTALVSKNWASIGLTKPDGSALDASNFTWVGNNLEIINVTKNALIITNHPTMVGNPLLYKPIPNKNLAYKIDFEFTFYENGITPSNTSFDTIQTQKYLEYLSSAMGKGNSNSNPLVSKLQSFAVFSNVWTNANDVVPFNVSANGMSNVTLYDTVSTNQTNDKQEYRYIPNTVIDYEVIGSIDYVLPYSNVNANVIANNFIGTTITGLNTLPEEYNLALLTNNTPNQNPYKLLWLHQDAGSMGGTQSVSTLQLNGVLLPSSVGVIATGNPSTDTGGIGFINQIVNLDLLSLPINTLHELRMDSLLTGTPITANGITSFAKYATTKFYISNR